MIALILVGLGSLSGAVTQSEPENAAAGSLEKLADDFWTWRAKYAPFTGDDVNRIERPGGTRDFTLEQAEKYLERNFKSLFLCLPSKSGKKAKRSEAG